MHVVQAGSDFHCCDGRQKERIAALVLGAWLSSFPWQQARAAEEYAFYHENVMGTSLELRVHAGSREAAQEAEDRVLREIDRLEKTPVQHLVYHRFDEAYRLPLSIGLLALALELVLAGTFAVRVP